MDYTVIHLNGLHCSGRAVRVQPLDPDERDEVLMQAAKAVGMDGTLMELKRQEWKLGTMQMIKEVTVDSCDDPMAAETKWKKVTPAVLDESYKTFFTAKDHALLMAAFRMFHEVSDEEINSIVGKAMMVSVG